MFGWFRITEKIPNLEGMLPSFSIGYSLSRDRARCIARSLYFFFLPDSHRYFGLLEGKSLFIKSPYKSCSVIFMANRKQMDKNS